MKANQRMFIPLLSLLVAVAPLAAEETKTDQRPIEEVKAKAEAGDADSQIELGWRYHRGEGVVADHAEGLKWYRKAAAQNNADAQYRIGICYSYGYGVEVDKAEAVKWYRKSAEQNNPKAEYFLGDACESGSGLTKNEIEAVMWYRKSAEGNYGPAQDTLATAYERGYYGLKRDYVEACKWYMLEAERAFDADTASAQSSLKDLEEKMKPEQIAEARKRANDFAPRKS